MNYLKQLVTLVLVLAVQQSFSMNCVFNKAEQEAANLRLFDAAFTGDISRVNLAITRGANINAQAAKIALYGAYESCTALMLAIKRGHTQIIELLLDEGADVNVQNKLGLTAFVLAIWHGQPEIAELLFEKSDVQMTTHSGEVALLKSAGEGYTRIVRLLLARGVAVNAQNNEQMTALMLASQKGHVDIINMLITHAFNNIIIEIDKQNCKGETALVLAAINNHADIVKLLLDAGADVNIVDTQDERTPLMQASGRGHVRAAQELLDAPSIEVNTQDSQGNTALILACKNNRTEIVKLLLDRSDINTRLINHDGQTAYDVAQEPEIQALLMQAQNKTGDQEIVNALNVHGVSASAPVSAADIHAALASDADGSLVTAATYGRTQTVKSLLDAGASLIGKHAAGIPALEAAAKNGHLDTVKVLLTYICARNNLNFMNSTALISAAQYGHHEIAKELVAKGATINLQDSVGKTALVHAILGQHEDIVTLLLNAHAQIDQSAVIAGALYLSKPVFANLWQTAAAAENKKLLV